MERESEGRAREGVERVSERGRVREAARLTAWFDQPTNISAPTLPTLDTSKTTTRLLVLLLSK